MALPAAARSTIVAQLNAAFDALEAGTLFNQDLLHQAFEFSTGGRTYIVQLHGLGETMYPRIVMLIKQRPL